MAPIAILFGVLLTLLGGGLYFYSGMVSITALIPAFFGIPLIVAGIVARNEKARMHAMHGAALLGLIGFAVPAYRVIRALINGAEMNLAIGGQIAMSVLCALFVALCVKSFIDARILRKQQQAQPPQA
jgi:hypothetical protein